MNPACGSATGEEGKDVKVALIGIVWWVALMIESRGSKSLFLTEGLLSSFQSLNETLP
jgi:hypothetical protein